MMEYKKILFIGPLGRSNDIPKTGSSIKNYYIVNHLKQMGLPIEYVNTSCWKKRPYVWFDLFKSILSSIDSKIIISTSFASAYTFIKLLRLFIPLKNVIYWVIGGALAQKIKDKRFDVSLYRALSCIIVEGESMRLDLAQLNVTNSAVVPNFKNIIEMPIIKYRHPNDEVKFVFLSRIIPDKGCDLILECCRRLNEAESVGSYTIDFYGPIDDSYQETFFDQINYLPNVNYRGFLDLRDSNNYETLAEYDVLLFPTFWETEGFPGIIIDGFIAGLPIIASRWNMNAELIEHGKSGIIIEPKCVESLEEAMLDVLKHPNKYFAMRSYCQLISKRYEISSLLSYSKLRELSIIEEQS